MTAGHHLRLVPPPGPPARLLGFAVLQMIGDPGVVSCVVCDGPTTEIAGGARCVRCGSVASAGAEPEVNVPGASGRPVVLLTRAG